MGPARATTYTPSKAEWRGLANGLVSRTMSALGGRRHTSAERGAGFDPRVLTQPGPEGDVDYGATAIAEISTFTSRGIRATSMVARAGGAFLKYMA
jgi:hypothetical protein